MSKARQAVVVGGSLGGLFAANLLLRAGWDVHVYERVAEELEGRGAGIVTHPELMQALRSIGVSDSDAIGVSVEQRITLSKDGSILARRALPQVLTAWGQIYSILRAAFPAERYHNGHTIEFVSQTEDYVHLRTSKGTDMHAQLVVAADGLRSSLRQALLPGIEPLYAGYVAWRGLVDESKLSQKVRDELMPYFSFGLPHREQMVAYPVAGRDRNVAPGHRRYNFVWYRPADRDSTFRDMTTDSSGKVWMDGIPPPLIRTEVIQEARKAAQEVLAPQFAEVVEKTEHLFFQPIFDLESPRLAVGRIALLGDAAFVARPHCGMGVTKAAGDAMALVESLQDENDVRLALARYENKRQSFGTMVVGHARSLGAYMQAQLLTQNERMMAERYRTPEAVMRETAVAPEMSETDTA